MEQLSLPVLDVSPASTWWRPRFSLVASVAIALSAIVATGCLSVAPHQKSAPAIERPVTIFDAGNLVTSYAEVNGAWLRVRSGESDDQVPGALPVVFVHGYGSRLEAFRYLQPALSGTRPTLSFDQRGFGESERVPGEYGPDVHAKDLLALLDAAGLGRVILVGHSYGGGVATRAALLDPDRIAGIVLVDAFVLASQMPQAFRWAKAPVVGELLFGAFYKEVPGEKYIMAFHDRERFVTAEALDEMQEMMSRPGSVHAALETVRGMNYADWESDLDRLTPPTLVVWGEEDRVTPLSQGRALAARLDSAQFEVIAGSGHMPLWERPRAILAAVAPFVAALDVAERSRPSERDLPAGESSVDELPRDRRMKRDANANDDTNAGDAGDEDEDEDVDGKRSEDVDDSEALDASSSSSAASSASNETPKGRQ